MGEAAEAGGSGDESQVYQFLASANEYPRGSEEVSLGGHGDVK